MMSHLRRRDPSWKVGVYVYTNRLIISRNQKIRHQVTCTRNLLTSYVSHHQVSLECSTPFKRRKHQHGPSSFFEVSLTGCNSSCKWFVVRSGWQATGSGGEELWCCVVTAVAVSHWIACTAPCRIITQPDLLKVEHSYCGSCGCASTYQHSDCNTVCMYSFVHMCSCSACRSKEFEVIGCGMHLLIVSSTCDLQWFLIVIDRDWDLGNVGWDGRWTADWTNRTRGSTFGIFIFSNFNDLHLIIDLHVLEYSSCETKASSLIATICLIFPSSNFVVQIDDQPTVWLCWMGGSQRNVSQCLYVLKVVARL